MKEIIFFSNNKNKIIELSSLFTNSSFILLSLNNFKIIKSPKEIGKSFNENAKIKSKYGFNNFKKICFADDSGICIEAMNGKPGIESKRLLTKNKNPQNILKEIILTTKEKKNAHAFFQTTICLTLDKKNHLFFEGIVKGTISKQIKGMNGFGYDPIFIPEGHNKTFAEMSSKEKNSISHRSLAVVKLKNYLQKLI